MTRKRTTDPKHKFFRRWCRRCDELFQPKSKYNNLCPECIEESGRWRGKKRIINKKEKK